MEHHPPWLPLHWTAETKVVKKGPTSGTTYKCYTELSTGKKFYSKPKVLSYLKLAKHKNGDNSNEQTSTGTKELQPELSPTLTEVEWNSIAEIYNSTVSGDERIPLASSKDEGSSTQQNSNNPTPQVWETTTMEEDPTEMGNDQVIIINTSETDDLMEVMLTTSNNNQSDNQTQNKENKPEQEVAAEEEVGEKQEDTVKVATNSNKSLCPSRRSSKRLAGIEPELHTLLADPTTLKRTGRRSARLRSKLYSKSLEVPDQVNIDKVEEKPIVENVEKQHNEKNGIVPPAQAPPPSLRFHKEMLSKHYIQFALKVLGCEYEVVNEPEWRTAKKFYEEEMSDPFFEYACENVPGTYNEILPPPLGYYDNDMEKQLIEFDRDVERCKELPNFGFPMSFDFDVSVHFESPSEKDDYELGNGEPELGSSGYQSNKGN